MSAPPDGPVSGATRLAGVIGWPVRHSLSPRIHNAAFDAAGLDWVYVAMPVEPGRTPAALVGMDALGIEGLSVTMPHKSAVAAGLEHLTDDAVALGAVNCVFRDGPHIVGDNTDGSGFVDALRIEELDPAGMRCLVVGTGGAARAVVRSLAGAGADAVVVAGRRAEPAATAAALAGTIGRVGSLDEVSACDLVINATPVGMGDDGGIPFDPGACADGTIVVDLVYHPVTTPLLRAADVAGHRTIGGLGMLVHQAALAFSRWTGIEAPLSAMYEAARSGLADPGRSGSAGS